MATQVSQIQQWFNGYKNNLSQSLRDGSKPWSSAFDKVEERTGVDRVNLFLGEFGCPGSGLRHRVLAPLPPILPPTDAQPQKGCVIPDAVEFFKIYK